MKKSFDICISNRANSGADCRLECRRLLRSVPNRRAVYDGFCDGKPAVIKIFLSPLHKKRHGKREYQGLNELAKRGIQTARVLAFGQDAQRHCVLVLEKIENATDVFSLLESSESSENIDAVLRAVFTRLAHMNQAGVLQRDLHLGNFLWNKQGIHVIDPAEMKFKHAPLSQADCDRQAAILLASLPEFISLCRLRTFLESYFAAHQWPLTDEAIARVETLTKKVRQRLIEQILRKTKRRSKRYLGFKQSSCRGSFRREVFPETVDPEFIATLNQQMENGRLLKRGNTCLVSCLDCNNRTLVVKRYNHKGLWHSFRHTLKGSRAQKCWRFGLRMEMQRIATARPLGFLERRRYGLIWESYIFNEYVDGPEITDFQKDPCIPPATQQAVTEKVRQLLDRLSHFNMTHGDLKPGNILIRNNEPVLIDLDSMKRHRTRWLLNFYKRKMDINIRERRIL